MSSFLYARPSDNVLSGATISVNTGTEDPDYLATNINDLHPEKPAKLTTTSGSWVADLGSAKQVDLAAIIHHNLDAAIAVTLQGHTANSWGAPTLSTAFTIPARLNDQYTVNIWLDLTVLFPSAVNRTFRYWRLNVTGVNSAALFVGEWRLEGTRRTFGTRDIKRGSTRMWRRPAILHETELFVRRAYDLGVTIRTVTVDVELTDPVLADLETWYRDAQGIIKPFLIVPNSSETDAWLVGFTNQERPYRRLAPGYHTATIEFQELSRGLYP